MNRKKRFFDDIWNFNFEELFRSFEEDINRINQYNSSEFQEGEPISYGYSVRVGPDTNYKPEIRQWGNLNDYRRKQGLPELQFPFRGLSEPALPTASTSDESYVDFIDEEEILKIIVEVPGFTKDNLTISVDESGSEITLIGNSESKELNQTIKLPSKIEPKSTKSSIKNGVLEIRSKKIKDSSKKYQVKID